MHYLMCIPFYNSKQQIILSNEGLMNSIDNIHTYMCVCVYLCEYSTTMFKPLPTNILLLLQILLKLATQLPQYSPE